ncbi:MAG: hypothetical protein ACLGIV_02175 [Actinomycetes bacterium]
MDSSLIFLVIIGLWAAVLVPHWVRRRAALGGSRVRDRFSGAMHVLARRPRARRPHPPTRSYVHRPRTGAHHVAARTTPEGAPRRPARLPVGGLVVLVLLAALLVAVPASVVAAALGAIPFWAPAAPLGALIWLLAGLRLRALRRRARRGRARRGRATVRRPVDVPPVATAPGQVTSSPAAAVAMAPPDVDAPVAADESWTPVPVPPPTYTLKPQAPRRTVAAYAAPAPAPVVPAEAASQQPEEAQPEPARPAASTWDLDVVLERRRAAAG